MNKICKSIDYDMSTIDYDMRYDLIYILYQTKPDGRSKNKLMPQH